MMIKKFVAGLSAAVLAATMMSVSVSAAKLGDVVHPSEEDSKMNDSYYSIGAMGFYMGQDWTWNQGDWVGIDDAGKITVEYKISKVIADKTMSGKGTLGDMGVMVANLPDGVYPVDVKISDAKFVAEDGTTTVFDSLNSITSMDEDVVDVAQHTALFDTIAAVVAALVIIPACFSYGLDVGAGPSLLFVTLPTILQDIPLGRLFAIILYVAMIFAGVSSLQNMFEAVAESLMHKFPRLSRTAVLVILCVVCLGFGIGMETIDKWGPWMDLVSIYIIPIGATLGAISWFYVMKKDELLDAVNTGSGKLRGNLWYSVGRYVYVPLAVILCCVALFMHVAF